ncbi:hypothetical protein pb186bvf_018227 [Paramecium bursaria]
MDAQGEQLPKATVQQFIKAVTGGDMKCSNEFVAQVMAMAKEYINQVSDKANQICLDQGKKTISGDFFYQAIVQFGLEAQIPHLKEIEDEVKLEVNQVKNQNKARFQDEEHLKQLEQQQKILYENAKAENSKLFQQQEEESKRRQIHISFAQQDDI